MACGTAWYHSHIGTNYADGLKGLFIIEEKPIRTSTSTTPTRLS